MTATAHTCSARSPHTPAEIWALIADPDRWPSWNSAADSLVLDGPFVAGTRGTLTPPGGNPLPFTLVEVSPGQGYVSVTEIASTVSLRSTTRLGSDGDVTVVSQHSELIGPAAVYFAPAFGEALVNGVERTVGRLAGVAA